MFEAFGPLVGSTCVSFRGCVGWTWLGLEVDVQGYGGEGGNSFPFYATARQLTVNLELVRTRGLRLFN